jgi:cysteine desulfurase
MSSPLLTELPVYLDCASTTPMEPEVLEVVVRVMRDDFGNPSSRTHVYGQRAKAITERARDQVAAAVGCEPSEVIFTSGATESNNIAIQGLVDLGHRTKRQHVVTSAIEHKSVLEPVAILETQGFEVTVVRPDQSGVVSAQSVLDAVRSDTLLVSIMGVNNETGAIQPIEEIGRLLVGSGTWLHVDAAQLFGKVRSVDILRFAQLISLSGHKIFGPKGIGALICRRVNGRSILLQPLVCGGGQERGLRAGTLPAPLIAGLGTAAELSATNLLERREACISFRASAIAALTSIGARINCPTELTVPNILSIALDDIDAEAGIVAIKDLIAVSTGSGPVLLVHIHPVMSLKPWD